MFGSTSSLFHTTFTFAVILFYLDCHLGDSILNDDKTENIDHSQRFGGVGPMLEIEEISEFPRTRNFFENYVFQSKPVIVKSCVLHSAAFKRWDDEYFLSLEGTDEDDPVIVETVKKETRKQRSIDMDFHDFVEMYNTTDIYMVNPVPEQIIGDVPLPEPLHCEQICDDHLVDNVMWFSSGGTKSVVHMDAVDNILCVFRGDKEFVLVDPNQYRHKVDIDHPEGLYSDIDVDNVDYDKYPGLAEVAYYHVNISGGDCIYIPYKWIHQVRSYGRNIAVNVWWNHYENKNIDFDKCPGDIEPDLTLDMVDFLSFDELMGTLPAIRDQFQEFTTSIKELSYERLESMLTEGVDLEDLGVDTSVTAPLKKIFDALDIDQDGFLNYNEVSAATDQVWETVRQNMERFDSYMIALEEKFADEEEAEEDYLFRNEEDDLDYDDDDEDFYFHEKDEL